MNLQLEIRLIEKFFKKEKQGRYISFVSSKKNRKKLIEELSHLKDLQWNLFEQVNSFDPKRIENYKPFQTCYVISEDTSVDQTFITESEITRLTDSGKAFILVFGEAGHVYYEGEPPYNRYVSKMC